MAKIKKRKIVVDLKTYYYSVRELRFSIKIRCYGEVKSSYVEVSFCYVTRWYYNLYTPSSIRAIILYALDRGWKPDQPNQILTIEDGNSLAKQFPLTPWC